MKRAIISNLTVLISLILLIAVPGCRHNDGDGKGQNHGNETLEDHDEKASQVTFWDNKYEIFLEHKYLVVNTPTSFITHVSNLETLQPRRQGEVTFVLDNGSDAPIEHREKQPARDGIYIPELNFPKAGAWTVTLRIGSGTYAHSIKLPAFKVYASTEEVAHAPDPIEFDGISFLKEQQWQVLTDTAIVARKNIVERLPFSGTVSACPELKAVVSPPVAGRLLKYEGGNLPQIGDYVEAGKILAVIQPPLAGADLLSFISNKTQLESIQIELNVKVAEASAQVSGMEVGLDQAQRILSRTRQLHDNKTKSDRELEEAEFGYQKAKAAKLTTQQLLQSYEKALIDLDGKLPTNQFQDGYPFVEIKAPISGMVVQVNAVNGQYVQPEQQICTILDNSRIYISAAIPETDLVSINRTKDALYESLIAPGEYISILKDSQGKLIFTGKEVEAATRTVPLVYELDNKDEQLRIGMAINVHVETKHAENSIVIPKSALIDEDGQTTAFVMVSGETFEKRYLELGIRSGNSVEVISGLTEGERVVTKGAYTIRLASVSSSIPVHAH